MACSTLDPAKTAHRESGSKICFRGFFRNLLPEILFGTSAQRKTQIHHLPHMMVKMGCATQENVESVACIIFADSGISLCPIAFRSCGNRPEHYLNSSINTL